MLRYKDKKNKIHILTLNSALAEDVYERLNNYAGMELAEVIKSGTECSPITPDDILKLVRDIVNSKVLIIDLQSLTRPVLQRAYSDVVRFNRPDFNQYCYSVFIGDGPKDPPDSEKGLNAARKYLSNLRVDYSLTVFFINPFLYYSYDELREMSLYHNTLPEELRQFIAKYFKETKTRTEQVYRDLGLQKLRNLPG